MINYDQVRISLAADRAGLLDISCMEVDMNYFEVAIVSSKGQVVIPLAFRKRLGIRPGTKLMVLSDGHNLLLKPLEAPSLNPFRRLLEKSVALSSKKD